VITKKHIRLITFLAPIFGLIVSLNAKGEGLPLFLVGTFFGALAGVVLTYILQTLHWIAFRGSDGDGLGMVPFIGKILSLPFLPFIWLWRAVFRTAKNRKYKLARGDRARAEAEAQDRAFWNSPEGQKVRAAQLLAEAEKSKAEALAQIRLAETSGLAGIARGVAQEEEERQRRQLEELRSL